MSGRTAVGDRKRGMDVRKRGEREIQSESGKKAYTIRRKTTCMDGHSDVSYHRWK